MSSAFSTHIPRSSDMPASRKRRERIAFKLWGKCVALGPPAIRLRRDPLRRRYAVNRHGFRATGTSHDVTVLHAALLRTLPADGWRGRARSGFWTHPTTDVQVFLDGPAADPAGLGWFLDINFY